MLFSGSKNFNIKKTQAFKEKLLNPHLNDGVICSTCQKPLIDEESMNAGMGPICLERSRYAEKLTREELVLLESTKESLSKGLFPSRTALLKFKQEETPRFVTMLSTDSSKCFFFDRTEMTKHYEKTGSIALAIASSLYEFESHEGEYISSLSNPKDADMEREFRKFQKDLRKEYKERSEFIKANPFIAYYQQIQTKKNLSEEQLEAREKLLEEKDLYPEKFQDSWGKGKIHLSTWISRLQATQLTEARQLSVVLSPSLKDFEVKDFGLTDVEIEAGLNHSHQSLEKHLFKSFLAGNSYLSLKMKLYEKFKTMELPDKMSTTKLFAEISSGKTLLPASLETLNKIKQKYNL